MLFRKHKDLEISYYPISKVVDGLIYSWGHIEFIAKNGNGYEFYSKRARDSWGLPVFPLDRREDSLPRRLVGTVGFRDGSLIQNFKDGKIYLISNATKRLLTAPLEDYGFSWSDVVAVSDQEASFHSDGEDI